MRSSWLKAFHSFDRGTPGTRPNTMCSRVCDSTGGTGTGVCVATWHMRATSPSRRPRVRDGTRSTTAPGPAPGGSSTRYTTLLRPPASLLTSLGDTRACMQSLTMCAASSAEGGRGAGGCRGGLLTGASSRPRFPTGALAGSGSCSLQRAHSGFNSPRRSVRREERKAQAGGGPWANRRTHTRTAFLGGTT